MLSKVSSYSLSLVNAAVSFGLLLLYTQFYRTWDWDPPFRAPKAIVILFFLSNLFLVVVPFFPPISGSGAYRKLPYWVSRCLNLPCFICLYPAITYSHIRLAVLPFPLLVYCIGICGVCGSQSRKDISWNVSGFYRMTESRGTLSVKCL